MMMTRRILLASGAMAVVAVAASRRWPASGQTTQVAVGSFKVTHTEAEWRKLLTPEQFAVLRQAGTERPFTSPLLNEHRHGIFACAGCNLDVFSSTTKFDSGTGWPSFWAPLENAVGETTDTSFGMIRTALHCSQCGGHLGHVFDDGPKPTGLRYCMDGVALTFKPTTA